MRFRVIELKELLRSIGQSTKGRKPELMQRSTDLLRHGSPKIQVKIQEIWERSHNSRKPDSYQKMAQRYTPMKGASQVPLHQHIHHHPYPYHFKAPRGQHVIHPDVKFKAHPFLVKFDTIIRPTALGVYACVYVGLVPEYEVCICLLYTSPSPRDATLSRMPSSA